MKEKKPDEDCKEKKPDEGYKEKKHVVLRACDEI